MKKKFMKKLNFNKSTVANLGNIEQRKVLGGAETVDVTCDTCQTNCGTCQQTYYCCESFSPRTACPSVCLPPCTAPDTDVC